MWIKWFLVISLIRFSGALDEDCPALCTCSKTFEDSLSVKCSSIQTLFKYSLRNKDFDPQAIDLSDSNISKIDYNFDKFDNLVKLDLSSNHLEYVNKFLRNCTNLKSLKLNDNNLKTLTSLPQSLEILDVSNNFFKEIPTELNKLHNLKHLELSGNPIECDCDSLKFLKSLQTRGATVADFKCSSQGNKKMKLWAEYKISEECQKLKLNTLDAMMGDEPSDVEIVAEDTLNKKSLPMTSLNELNEAQVWEGGNDNDNDDDKQFLQVVTDKPVSIDDAVEGSGDLSEPESEQPTSEPRLAKMLNYETEEPEGSGDDAVHHLATSEDTLDYYDGSGDNSVENATSTTEAFITGHFHPFFVLGNGEHNTTTEEPFEEPPRPTLFLGNIDWDAEPSEVPMVSSSSQSPIIEEPIVKKTADAVESAPDSETGSATKSADLKEEESKEPIKTSMGTIICIAIIIILLIGLILISVIKGHLRRRKDRRLLRQEKADAEKGDKEMVEMNKALLGKPAPVIQKNGTYELVPLHDNSNKKPANGNLGSKTTLNNSPPPKRNGSVNQLDSPQAPKLEEPPQEVLHNGSSATGTPEKPLTNGDSSHLAPPSDYVPVYGPEAGRVKIKLTETPKAKTPVLVTRSRSNAGDIIITPAEQSPKHKSVT